MKRKRERQIKNQTLNYREQTVGKEGGGGWLKQMKRIKSIYDDH